MREKRPGLRGLLLTQLTQHDGITEVEIGHSLDIEKSTCPLRARRAPAQGPCGKLGDDGQPSPAAINPMPIAPAGEPWTRPTTGRRAWRRIQSGPVTVELEVAKTIDVGYTNRHHTFFEMLEIDWYGSLMVAEYTPREQDHWDCENHRDCMSHCELSVVKVTECEILEFGCAVQATQKRRHVTCRL
jgi:hypothetical protein